MYVCTYVRMYVCTYVRMHACMHACNYVILDYKWLYIVIIIIVYILCILLPTNAACCPDINIQDVVLLNKIGDIAEHTAYTQSFLV